MPVCIYDFASKDPSGFAACILPSTLLSVTYGGESVCVAFIPEDGRTWLFPITQELSDKIDNGKAYVSVKTQTVPNVDGKDQQPFSIEILDY